MAHLAVVLDRGLAVVVHVPFGMLPDQRSSRRDVLAEHVDHHGRAQQLRLRDRPPGDAADVRVELVDRARLDRVVARVVRARRQLVDDHAVVLGDEQLDGERAGQLEAAGQRPGQLVRTRFDRCRHVGRRDRQVQDVVAVDVVHDRERHIVLAVAGHQDRRLEGEIDESLEDRRREVVIRPDPRQVILAVQHDLAVTVVAALAGLEHGRVPQFAERGDQIGPAVHRAPRRGLDAVAVDEGLLGDAVLRHAQQVGALRHGDLAAHLVQRVGVHVLELIGEHVGLLGQLADRGLVVVVGDDLEVADLRRRAVRGRVEHADAESHVFRAQRHHAAELAAADDADGRAGHQARDRAVRFLRQAGHWIRPPFPSVRRGTPAAHPPAARRWSTGC